VAILVRLKTTLHTLVEPRERVRDEGVSIPTAGGLQWRVRTCGGAVPNPDRGERPSYQLITADVSVEAGSPNRTGKGLHHATDLHPVLADKGQVRGGTCQFEGAFW